LADVEAILQFTVHVQNTLKLNMHSIDPELAGADSRWAARSANSWLILALGVRQDCFLSQHSGQI